MNNLRQSDNSVYIGGENCIATLSPRSTILQSLKHILARAKSSKVGLTVILGPVFGGGGFLWLIFRHRYLFCIYTLRDLRTAGVLSEVKLLFDEALTFVPEDLVVAVGMPG